MSKDKFENPGKVPVGQKAAFGAGHFVLNLLPGVLGVYLQVFILTAFGMDPLWAGLLGGLPRIFDAITDPIMGFISDNTQSKYGRRRPYILSGAIISGVLFILMWQLDENASMTLNFWYVMILQILFLIGNTMFATPLVGLGYEMSPDYNERTRLMSLANSMGQVAWMIVPWLYVIIPDKDTFDNPAEGVRTMAFLVGGVCIVFGALPALFCKGINAEKIENTKEINFKTLASNLKQLFEGIVQVSKNKPFMKLCGATFLVFNGFQLVAAFSVFIIVFYLYQGSWEMAGTWPAWFNTINAVVTAFIVIPIISKMATQIGKRNAFLVSTFLSIVGYVLKWWGFDIELNERFNDTEFAQTLNSGLGAFFEFLNPYLDSLGLSWFSIDVSDGVPWLIFLPIPLFAFGMGGLFTLMMSMTADVCDLDELENGMPRKEGTFGAIYWWMVKVGQALAIILSGVVLKIVGFDQNITDQATETMTQLRIADIVVPASTAALAFLVMWGYKLDEDRVKEIGNELKKRRNKPKKTGSMLYQSKRLSSFAELDLKQNLQYDKDFSNYSSYDMKKAFSLMLNRGMHGMCFSPYIEGQDLNDELSDEQIRRRINIIKPYTNWIRSFSCTKGNELTPKIAKQYDLHTLVGASIGTNKSENDKEIQQLIELGKSGFVDIAAVGNEALLRGELPIEDILNYIEKVKSELPDIQVGYVDSYSIFHEYPSLIDACDVILINCYPFWEGVENDLSPTYLRHMYDSVKEIAKDKPIIISETGWPSDGDKTENAEPSKFNALKYFINVNNWARKEKIKIFYFSSFDEAWKIHHEGDVGQTWGIWNEEEKLKF